MSAELVIIDYEVGNLFNLVRAVKSLGVEPVVTKDPRVIKNAARVVLPGVGAFRPGIENLQKYDLANVVKDFAETGRPLFGICLGMQLLFSESEENGTWSGLN